MECVVWKRACEAVTATVTATGGAFAARAAGVPVTAVATRTVARTVRRCTTVPFSYGSRQPGLESISPVGCSV
jgi:hypothetical protein